MGLPLWAFAGRSSYNLWRLNPAQNEAQMGILDRLSPSSQFIEVIEWLDSSPNTLLYRFPVKDQEIKNGAQLIVRESQSAVFVHEGQIVDVFGPGRYSVDGGNTPILS